MADLPDPTPMGPDDVASIDEWGHLGYDLALETQAYQAMLEGHRADPDDALLHEDMLKAKAVMETLWLQQKPTT